jgi:hypothetical protein
MVFSNYNNSQEDIDFLAEFPIPNEDDWVGGLAEDKEGNKYCCDCEFYDNNPILPCAVNPQGVHNANECQDYSESEE